MVIMIFHILKTLLCSILYIHIYTEEQKSIWWTHNYQHYRQGILSFKQLFVLKFHFLLIFMVHGFMFFFRWTPDIHFLSKLSSFFMHVHVLTILFISKEENRGSGYTASCTMLDYQTCFVCKWFRAPFALGRGCNLLYTIFNPFHVLWCFWKLESYRCDP